jgi:hypothetical protein
MKNQEDRESLKEYNNILVTYLKEMEIYKLPDKEFKINYSNDTQ